MIERGSAFFPLAADRVSIIMNVDPAIQSLNQVHTVCKWKKLVVTICRSMKLFIELRFPNSINHRSIKPIFDGTHA